jgi:hypothetical protein
MGTAKANLVSKLHPVSGVKIDINGFPIFDSKFTATLDSSLLKATDYQQFKSATLQLHDSIKANPSFGKQFTQKQLDQISKGIKPEGYTWHHHQDTGVLQLVDSALHQKTGHTGGRSIWGGGANNR